jgi:heat shock protein HslJ
MTRVLVLVLLAAVTACGSPAVSPSASSSAEVEGSWQLTRGSVGGAAIPLVDGHPITLTIAGSTIGGRAACNEYGGRIIAAGGGIELTELMSTGMACLAEGVMDAESAYLGALGTVRAIGLDTGTLVLRGAATELRFARLPEPPTAKLVDTRWTLETLFVGDVASPPMGEPAFIQLRSDGTVTGSTGCRSFSGEWIERGEQILATTLAMDDRECPAELTEQDGHVVGVIGDGFVPAIADGLLTLTDPGGVGLVYRADR